MLFALPFFLSPVSAICLISQNSVLNDQTQYIQGQYVYDCTVNKMVKVKRTKTINELRE